MRIILEDSHCSKQLYPLTATRHTALLRLGILTIKEKWEIITGNEVVFNSTPEKEDIIISANLIPDKNNFEEIIHASIKGKPSKAPAIQYPWDMIKFNERAIRDDFDLLTAGRRSQSISNTNKISGEVFLEKGVIMEHSIINAQGGPVYIGKDAHVMEGSLIRGPFALCEGSVLKMGAKIYSGTTIGPWCIVGGEVKNTIFLGFSNKAHDGYLGDSVIGEWCNLGAGTSNSNVKNSGAEISYLVGGSKLPAGNKAGLIMGDYSRSAINTSFNTGSIVGVCCNIFGHQLAGPNTPNFTWGNERYLLDKAIRDIENWKRFKNHSLTASEVTIINELYFTNQ